MNATSIKHGELSQQASSHDALVRRCTEEMERRGIAWHPLALSHGITLRPPPAEGARLSVRSEQAMLRDAERLTGDSFLGWTLGRFELRDLGVFGYAVRSAPDLRAALHIMVEMFGLLSEGPQLVFEESGGEATLASTVDLGNAINQVGLRMTLAHLRELTGPEFRPLRAGLPETDPDILVGLCERAGTRIESTSETSSFVTFSADTLDRPLPDADHGLAQVMRRIWDDERQRLQLRTTSLLRLQRAIMSVLPEGQPKLERIAETMGLSKRELRLEMRSLDTNLPRATDLIRAGLVDRLLAEPGMTLERAAKALGYGEPAALTRAHLRWRGVPPIVSGVRSPVRVVPEEAGSWVAHSSRPS
ncbi:MAG: AraC family transcriptional regulator ligand-binding domain-containing protein [Geminicoccaceae bacterium]